MHRKRLFIKFFYFPLFILTVLIFNTGSFAADNNWSAKIMYVKSGTLIVHSKPFIESDSVGTVYYLNKVLILSDPQKPDFIGWSNIIYPQKGYIISDSLITPEEKHALDIRFHNNPNEDSLYNDWYAKIVYAGKDYTFIKKYPNFLSANTGAVKNKEPLISIIHKKAQNKIWMQVIFPFKGYVYIDNLIYPQKSLVITNTNNLNIEREHSYMALATTYSPIQIPYEKNLSNYFTPLGFNVEFGGTNWLFNYGLSYSYSQAHLKKYILSTHLIYLYLRYNLLKLFNDNFEIYIQGGGGYHLSSFVFKKYPQLSNRFPKEKASGYIYLGSAGLEYHFWGLFIGAEYFYWGSKEAVFGPNPEQGKFTNQYKLFPGSNQLKIKIGYLIKL